LRRNVKKAQIGAVRRISPPWYGFKANLAIALRLGIAAASSQWVKSPERNCRAKPVPS
jgi:hypothetical protein